MAVQAAAVRTEARVEPRSSHVEDTTLQPFLQARFDPADYLNATLPSLTFSHAARDSQSSRVPLAELTAQTQHLLSQLNAQTSRLTNTLNQLTDEILRSGSRLAYEVEILRGETVGLSDALSEGLREDIVHFVPAGLGEAKPETSEELATFTALPTTDTPAAAVIEPEYINKLRTLTNVRERLESVIRVFGEAMQWPVAPSELSATSSFISVSAPSAGGPDATRDLEEKGREYAQKLRAEISDLLESAATAEDGIAAATRRVGELKDLGTVWKGTAEEKARTKMIEQLTKPIEDEQKAIARRAEAKRRTASPSVGVDYRYGESANAGRQGGYGFIKNLQKLKDDIYLD